MGYDALPGLRGVFFNEILSKRSLFEDHNAEIFNYVGTSFVKRSDIAKLLKQFGISLSWIKISFSFFLTFPTMRLSSCEIKQNK